jgi:dipeptidase D
MVLDNIEPKSVMHWFEELCRVPHGSGNTKKISDLCAAFARERCLEYYQDELNDIIIKKPGTPGYEKSAPVIIQGHLDMVCQAAPGRNIDFLTDGLELKTDGESVWAEGTTLGADDGIAVAMALALLDSRDIPHPPIEAVFTVDEETGMYGAAGLDVSPLRGRIMLNIDSEDEGVFTVGCAGGARANLSIPVSRVPFTGVTVSITLSGLIGGHSGQEIDKCRGNANILMGRVLRACIDGADARLVSLGGGSADNAIPTRADAVIAVAPESFPGLKAAVSGARDVLTGEYAVSDPGLSLEMSAGAAEAVSALDAESTLRVIDALTLVPNGVQAMSADIPGLVETSLTLGILSLGEDALRLSFSVRSSVASRKQLLKTKLARVCALLGGTVDFAGEYPAWEYCRSSKLRDTMVEVYRRQYGAEPQIVTIHAGLECGLFSEKLPGLDCVSFGPDMHDIHTCRERMDIASVQRVWSFLLEVLASLK